MPAARKPAGHPSHPSHPSHKPPQRPEQGNQADLERAKEQDGKRAAAERHPDKKVYVAVDALSWRPHLLPRGSEVSQILPDQVIAQGLKDGRLTRQAPESV